MDPTGPRRRAPSPSSSGTSIPPLPTKTNPSLHRRAHSETFLRIPDDFLFDVSDPDFSISDLDFPSLSDETSDPPPPPQPDGPTGRTQSGAHIRSLSMDAAFFEGLGFQAGGEMNVGGGHRRSGSMDGSNLPAGFFEAESPGPSTGSDYAKKALAPERLAELALIDPKRAKRLKVNEINEQTRQWHCPACANGPGAIDWYKGLQPLMTHAKTKGATRVKLHRELATLLEEELRRRGTSVIPVGEQYGKWQGLKETTTDHEIVWPPMVVIMNTFLDTDENDKLEKSATLFRPKLMVVGASAYTRLYDMHAFARLVVVFV